MPYPKYRHVLANPFVSDRVRAYRQQIAAAIAGGPAAIGKLRDRVGGGYDPV